MKVSPGKASQKGFTLVELLVVISLIVLMLILIRPMPTSAKQKAYLITCLNRQKQVSMGFILWKGDHGDRFPWQVSVTNNGAMEFCQEGTPAPQFNLLNDYIKDPSLFVCPVDKIKAPATNHMQLTGQNISYFIALDSSTNEAAGILTGDRHLQASNISIKPGLFVLSNGIVMNWTLELHSGNYHTPFGAMSFRDGHVEFVRGTNLDYVFQRQGLATSRYAVP